MPGIIAEVAAATTALGLAAGGIAYTSLWPTSQIAGRALIAGTNAEEIALTFDDGPNDAATPQLLEVLARHGVHATFFNVGNFARLRPDLTRQVLAAGHIVGNHTMSHPYLSTQSPARVRQELADCNALLEDITGEAVRFFRPPFGARRPYVMRAARGLGLTPVLWNVTGHDWDPIGVAGILANLDGGIAHNRRHGQGSNLLLHDGGHLAMGIPRMDTVRAVDQLLTERLRPSETASATRFVTVDVWAS
ncbi:MAG: polysaccharide deacetylase family protein [Acidobacteriaceae bacterium]|nr:polysaccharide deacetylase family protein [Acidobacteriaceae bacterium]